LKNLFLKTYPSFNQSISELTSVLASCTSLEDVISLTAGVIINSISKGGKLLTCGNGGSAADALHLTEEMVGRYNTERRALPAICLNADVTALTCIGNDYGYDNIFSRQVEALGKPGDILVGFTTSGNSANVVTAFKKASAMKIITILLAGKDGGNARGVCDYQIVIPSYTTARIQEVHTLVLHQWLEAIDVADWGTLLA
jgi:phosphoheptose isomerase